MNVAVDCNGMEFFATTWEYLELGGRCGMVISLGNSVTFIYSMKNQAIKLFKYEKVNILF
jgi:hypothetical protein